MFIKEITFSLSKELEDRLENSISIWFSVNQKPYEVELHLSSIAAKTLKRRPISKTQRVLKEYKDGSMEIVVNITNNMEILPIIGYWLPHITVLSPKELQDEFDNRITKYQSQDIYTLK